MIEFLLPIKTINEANTRSHWRVKAKRVRAQRGAARLFMLAALGAGELELPCTVTLTRISPGTLDDDGPPSALKGVRDGIAEALGVDDKLRDVVRYKYEQQKGKPMGVLVTVTAGIVG